MLPVNNNEPVMPYVIILVTRTATTLHEIDLYNVRETFMKLLPCLLEIGTTQEWFPGVTGKVGLYYT